MEYHVLIPTDFSDNAWNATVYAMNLLAEEACTFYFLNAMNAKISAMSNMSKKFNEAMSESAIKELRDLKAMAEAAHPKEKHRFEIIFSSESLNDAIATSIKKYKLNLVVMGTKGATGAKEVFFGSNTVGLISKLSLCPLIIVPEDCQFKIPKQIAFPTNFIRPYRAEDLQPLFTMSQQFGTRIRVVHIQEKSRLSAEQRNHYTLLKELLETYEHSFHWMPIYASKTHEIFDFIEELEIDMLVMINYKHSLLERFTREPVIKKIGYHPAVPFMVIPD
ncbi:universal stress protein [Mangrovimonas sp. DI 80]|uniref:universal stress protein n=1 Tax=Mangrovimonas sp. DI 80 TaxID=1779330 RepID=UPI000978C537|nr:universal stress protein [Mangrovimonas sp. DI 80]OMP30008.1 universal stress protein [Mangrovimonas sp. DI 80]